MTADDLFGKRSVIFVLHISSPAKTLAKLMQFMCDRDIIIESVHMSRIPDLAAAMLNIHCKLERDRLFYTRRLLIKTPGIISIEILEGKGNIHL